MHVHGILVYVHVRGTLVYYVLLDCIQLKVAFATIRMLLLGRLQWTCLPRNDEQLSNDRTIGIIHTFSFKLNLTNLNVIPL